MNLLIAATQIFAFAAGSRLWIEGQSSVHPWTCEAAVPQAHLEVDATAPEMVRALHLKVEIAGIECGNGTMNDKLREALHADKFPAIEYRLTQAERLPEAGTRIEATGDLSINGRTRRAAFQVDVKPQPDGTAQANGSIVMLMSDFGVEPPTAMLGLLRTADEITVRFTVRTSLRAAPHASAR